TARASLTVRAGLTRSAASAAASTPPRRRRRSRATRAASLEPDGQSSRWRALAGEDRRERVERDRHVGVREQDRPAARELRVERVAHRAEDRGLSDHLLERAALLGVEGRVVRADDERPASLGHLTA